MNILNIAESALEKAKIAGADKVAVSVKVVEEQEFTIDGNQLTLSKTGFDQLLNIKTVIDQRQASALGNQFDAESITNSAKNALTQAKASPQDEANGICSPQGTHSFSNADVEFDPVRVKNLLVDLMKQKQELYPKINLETSALKFIKTKQGFITSDNTILTSAQSTLWGFMFFTAKDGAKSSSFNYTDIALPGASPATPESLLNYSRISTLFKESTEQIHSYKLPEKFEGDVIIGPHCISDFAYAILMYLNGQYIFSKTSFLTEKLGTAVANPMWNLTVNPIGKDLPEQTFWTPDGYVTQNQSIIENGFLKTYRLNDYYARKMNLTPDRSEYSNMELAPGSSSLTQMISKIKKGILLNRYSGEMSENGRFAGVAKNSYYIEDGQIKFPLNETMVSGNLKDIMLQTQDISEETTTTGNFKMPWVHVTGLTVS